MNNKLIITWKPDVLTMIEHNGSFRKGDLVYSSDKGMTCRSEVESIKNVKSMEAARKILNKRNSTNIIYASYSNKEMAL